MTETCANCKFGLGPWTRPWDSTTEMFNCRRFPPTWRNNGAYSDDSDSAEFPYVRGEEWCGEWKTGKITTDK